MYTLGQRISFQEQYGEHLDAALKELLELPQGLNKELDVMEHGYDSIYKAHSFLNDTDLEESRKLSIDVAGDGMTDFIMPKAVEPLTLEGWSLPEAEIKPSDPMTFNEFLVAKEYIRQLTSIDKGKWDAIPYLCAVYLRKPGEAFSETFIEPDSDRMKEIMSLPLDVAMHVADWFDRHNQFLLDSFSVFQPSRTKGINMEELFDRWGWISFLSMIAKEGVFNIPGNGLNAIENAKAAKLYDVLVYASEKKDSEDIINHYYEQLNKK